MRVTISHTKSRQDAAQIVEETIDNLLGSGLPRPFRMTTMNKQWNGSTLRFNTAVAMGPLRMPISGKVDVTDTEIIIDVDLPPLLSRFVPEKQLKDAVEARIRGQ